jgi:hypothetical protein
MDGRRSVPPADVLYASEPGLRTQERRVRASACLLARRNGCAAEAVAAVLASDSGNALARQLQDGIAQHATARANDAPARDSVPPSGDGTS